MRLRKPKIKTLTITATRVGRVHDLPPLTVDCLDDGDAIAEAIYRYVRPKLASRLIEVMVDKDGTWMATAGFHVAGRGTWSMT